MTWWKSLETSKDWKKNMKKILLNYKKRLLKSLKYSATLKRASQNILHFLKLKKYLQDFK